MGGKADSTKQQSFITFNHQFIYIIKSNCIYVILNFLEQTDGLTDRQMDGRTDGLTDGRDGLTGRTDGPDLSKNFDF